MPLEVPDVPCSFCSYLRGDQLYTILERGPDVSILVTYEQRGRGHLLIIPTEHRPRLLDLTDHEASAVMAATVRATRAITSAFDPGGIAAELRPHVPPPSEVRRRP